MSAYVPLTCADPGFFSGGGGGWGGGSRPDVDDFFSLQLILLFTGWVGGVQWFYYRENYTFQRIRTGPTPYPPLDPHMSNLSDLMYAHNIKYCLVYFCVAFSMVLIIMTQRKLRYTSALRCIVTLGVVNRGCI